MRRLFLALVILAAAPLVAWLFYTLAISCAWFACAMFTRPTALIALVAVRVVLFVLLALHEIRRDHEED
jgi:phosphoglycerol transferase MdoB-like AlkP superfamily enzyme